MDIRFALGECTLGSLLVATTDRGVCAILLGCDPHALFRDLVEGFPEARLIGSETAFEPTVTKAVRLIEEPAAGFDLPLDLHGTDFHQRVWQALRAIPPGATASYTDIARRIGGPEGAKEVAEACAANMIAVAIPCHRVMRKDGTLSGYRWGTWRKRALLEREAAFHLAP